MALLKRLSPAAERTLSGTDRSDSPLLKERSSPGPRLLNRDEVPSCDSINLSVPQQRAIPSQ
ncbi:hypothetical protein N7463_001189 [Penicillium fimorum]|uniref:Uncharacterized protein n=1 Tax=Penicillium fimorum TaxID=1882269 RepID=A0A9X0CBL3_9EURO|nr:hypothetical protein N7463_001189 [Penicillium fimorum]